jgi:EAL domain-containing protein (putative c-di-GMP-specific phosphodiesterase class I)
MDGRAGAAATVLAVLAARTRVRTWVVTHRQRVLVAHGPHAPEVGSAWAPAADAFTTPLPGPRGREVGRLSALSGQVLDEELATALAVSLGALLDDDDGTAPDTDRTADDLDRLLASGGPRVVYQPAVPLADAEPGFVEALSRFPDGRPPDVWFREAAAVGRSVELEVAAADRGLQALGLGRDVSVNLSAATIASGALPPLLRHRPLEQVVVEVSEHEAVHDYVELAAALAPLREGGLRLAVDDAGAGYASLRHVVRLAPDVIKLDMSLVSGVDEDPARRELASALTSFAHRTGAVVVAEGVERQAEHDVLHEVGVDLGQGYLYARPGPLEPYPAVPA